MAVEQAVRERQGVTLSRPYRALGGGTFRRITVGDAAVKLVALSTHGDTVAPMFLVETWEPAGERIPQRERSGCAGVWATERAAMARAVEHVYEHSAVSSDAHHAAARWLVESDWGRR